MGSVVSSECEYAESTSPPVGMSPEVALALLDGVAARIAEARGVTLEEAERVTLPIAQAGLLDMDALYAMYVRQQAGFEASSAPPRTNGEEGEEGERAPAAKRTRFELPEDAQIPVNERALQRWQELQSEDPSEPSLAVLPAEIVDALLRHLDPATRMGAAPTARAFADFARRNFDPESEEGKAAIALALKRGNVNVVNLALSKGWRVSRNLWAIGVAIDNNQPEVLRLLLSQPDLDLSVQESIEGTTILSIFTDLEASDLRQEIISYASHGYVDTPLAEMIVREFEAFRTPFGFLAVALQQRNRGITGPNPELQARAAGYMRELASYSSEEIRADLTGQNRFIATQVSVFAGDLELLRKLMSVEPEALASARAENLLDHAGRYVHTNTEFLDYLLPLLGDLRIRESSLVRLAAEYGNALAVRWGLAHGFSPLAPPDVFFPKQHALNNAVKNRYPDVVRELFRDPRVDPSADGRRSLDLVRDPETLELLINHPAFSASPRPGEPGFPEAIVPAARHPNASMLEILHKHPTFKDLTQSDILNGFAVAVDARNREGVLYFLQHDLVVSAGSSDNAPIIIAAQEGWADVVELLLKRAEVDPTARSSLAIRMALQRKHRDVVRLLYSDDRVQKSLTDVTAKRARIFLRVRK